MYTEEKIEALEKRIKKLETFKRKSIKSADFLAKDIIADMNRIEAEIGDEMIDIKERLKKMEGV